MVPEARVLYSQTAIRGDGGKFLKKGGQICSVTWSLGAGILNQNHKPVLKVKFKTEHLNACSLFNAKSLLFIQQKCIEIQNLW